VMVVRMPVSMAVAHPVVVVPHAMAAAHPVGLSRGDGSNKAPCSKSHGQY
jgi:hypothetical protein